MNNIDILEELANNEHIRWSNWQKYVHSKCIKNDDGSLTIPKEYVEHWEYEINTDYVDLPENIKESDRREVRQILEKLNYSTLIAENKELKKDKEEISEEQMKQFYKDAQKALKEYRETQNKVAKLEEENKELKEKNKWKPIKEYNRQKYDWVLVKYFDGDYECVPEVAEQRIDGKWYTSEKQIPFEVKYFFDIQSLLGKE